LQPVAFAFAFEKTPIILPPPWPIFIYIPIRNIWAWFFMGSSGAFDGICWRGIQTDGMNEKCK